jgi:hypothetical protein
MIVGAAKDKLQQVFLDEIARARKRVDELRDKYPSATVQELAQRLVDSKKTWASTGGAISGLFGLISLPADLAFVTALQLSLIMEIALLHKVNLKSERARDEVFDVLTYSTGADTENFLSRAGPKLMASIAGRVFSKGGLVWVGRAMPVVAAPLTAYFNNRDIQKAGEAALRYYGTLRELPSRRKTVNVD